MLDKYHLYYAPIVLPNGQPTIRGVGVHEDDGDIAKFIKVIRGAQGIYFESWQEAGKWVWDNLADERPRITIRTFQPDQPITGETIETMRVHPSEFNYYINERIADGVDTEFVTVNEVFLMEARVIAKEQGCLLRIVIEDDPEEHLTVYFDKDARTEQELPAVFSQYSELLNWLL
jgi:hypothetical protein